MTEQDAFYTRRPQALQDIRALIIGKMPAFGRYSVLDIFGIITRFQKRKIMIRLKNHIFGAANMLKNPFGNVSEVSTGAKGKAITRNEIRYASG